MIPDISILISTRSRSASLRETLEHILRADSRGVSLEVIVVDNGSTDDTCAMVQTFDARLKVRYIFEPAGEGYGKGASLNRAFELPDLGSIIAVLDDDMTVDPGWVQGVIAICNRWPEKDIFTGRSRVNVKPAELPGWLSHPKVYAWTLSVLDRGPKDLELNEGGSISGNHFWIRRRVLEHHPRFEQIWNPELGFFNSLFDRGCQGMYGPDASVVHRIQPHLVDPNWAVKRAMNVGTTTARMRLIPYRDKIKASRSLRRHPVLGRLFCTLQWTRWAMVLVAARLVPGDRRIQWRILGTQWTVYYSELLRISLTHPDYRWLMLRRRA